MSIDISKLYKSIRQKKVKATLYLKGSRYLLSINRYIHAEQPNQQPIEWVKAFGSKSPQDVLNTFKIDRIEVYTDGEVKIFNEVKEFLKWAVAK